PVARRPAPHGCRPDRPGRRRRLRRPGRRLRDRLVRLVDRPPMTSAFINRLKVFRAERDWTQADLADRLVLSRLSILALVMVRYDSSQPHACRISRLFARPNEAIFIA